MTSVWNVDFFFLIVYIIGWDMHFYGFSQYLSIGALIGRNNPVNRMSWAIFKMAPAKRERMKRWMIWMFLSSNHLHFFFIFQCITFKTNFIIECYILNFFYVVLLHF